MRVPLPLQPQIEIEEIESEMFGMSSLTHGES
jgi:hypothetical protein